MRKLIANIICCGIPKKSWRKAVRKAIATNPAEPNELPKIPVKEDFLPKDFSNKAYVDEFLKHNIIERMDANRIDIFNPERAAFHKDRYEFAAKYIKDKKILDVAGGLGYGADLMMKKGFPKNVTAVELDAVAVDYAKAHYESENVKIVEGSILNLPFEDNTFDVVTSFETIEHVHDEAGQIREVKRVLKSGGLYILSTPNDWDNSNNPHHVRDYDYETITRLIKSNFDLLEMFNQNSGCDFEFNRKQPRGVIKTTADNYKTAECFIIIARNTK